MKVERRKKDFAAGINDLAVLAFVAWAGLVLGGCMGFAGGALVMVDHYAGREGVRIVCSDGRRTFAYRAPAAVVAVEVFEHGRHTVTVIDENGRERVIASDNAAMTCDGDSEAREETR